MTDFGCNLRGAYCHGETPQSSATLGMLQHRGMAHTALHQPPRGGTLGAVAFWAHKDRGLPCQQHASITGTSTR